MAITPDHFAVQSYCFRGFTDNQKVAELVKQIGLSGIELWKRHGGFGDEEKSAAAIAAYKSAGVRIASIGVETLGTDEAGLRSRFEFMKQVGTDVISANFKPGDMPDNFRLAEKLADEYDVKIAIHNHGGFHWLGNTQILEWVFAQTTKRIGLCLDTAWALDASEDPHKFIDLAGDRLYSIHVKDFVFARNRTPEDVVVGTGNIDLPGLFAKLNETGFDGPVVLEYEGDVDDPTPALTQCVGAMKAAF